jgi:hypothetical protein
MEALRRSFENNSTKETANTSPPAVIRLSTNTPSTTMMEAPQQLSIMEEQEEFIAQYSLGNNTDQILAEVISSPAAHNGESQLITLSTSPTKSPLAKRIRRSKYRENGLGADPLPTLQHQMYNHNGPPGRHQERQATVENCLAGIYGDHLKQKQKGMVRILFQNPQKVKVDLTP